jgi:cytochrome b561/polyisoprenoid-binding protein YceI
MSTSITPPPAGLTNTQARYGSVAKTFHWLTALLILTTLPLGLIANDLPYDTSAELAFKATMFSLHKTLGVTTFFVALARILWAFSQPKPALLNADKPIEAFLAETVHWLLYTSLVIVPLSGWIYHAASTGFAPIWWPFGQSLFFVPQSERVADFFVAWHNVFTKILLVSVVLHIAGALKHHVLDRDATLRRMLPGQVDLPANLAPPQVHRRPIYAAATVWAVAVAGGTYLGLQSDQSVAAPSLAAVQSDWIVQDGDLAITVVQLGSNVTGRFSDWTSEITFSPQAVDGQHGDVTVVISTGSLRLGSVTNEAIGESFFNSAAFPTATFAGPILSDADGYRVDATLSLLGIDLAVSLPFTLEIVDGIATMAATTTLDRRDFGMGTTYPDQSSVGFSVDVNVALTALEGE